MTPPRAPRRRQERTRKPATPKLRLWPLQRPQRRRRGRLQPRRRLQRRLLRRPLRPLRPLRRPLSDGTGWSTLGSIHAATGTYLLLWDGSTAEKVARRAVFPTLEHDDHDPGPLAERIRRDKRERSDRSSDDSSSDRDSCGTGSTSEANDIFDTLEDHLGYGSDSGSGW